MHTYDLITILIAIGVFAIMWVHYMPSEKIKEIIHLKSLEIMKSKAKEFTEALEKFDLAFQELNRLWSENINSENTKIDLCNHYPFTDSFQRLVPRVSHWVVVSKKQVSDTMKEPEERSSLEYLEYILNRTVSSTNKKHIQNAIDALNKANPKPEQIGPPKHLSDFRVVDFDRKSVSQQTIEKLRQCLSFEDRVGEDDIYNIGEAISTNLNYTVHEHNELTDLFRIAAEYNSHFIRFVDID